MPSDAFMELSPAGELIGESGDELYGQKSPYGMFEISSLDFQTDASKGKDKTIVDDKGVTHTIPGRPNPPRQPTESTDSATDKPKIKITKSIDNSSPDLFRYCCERDKETGERKRIEWAIISVREAGEDPTGEPRDPWLRIELRGLHVVDFGWSLDPDAAGEAAMKTETVTFDFDSMLIIYYQQLSTGMHQPGGKQNQWNFKTDSKEVVPIS